MKINIIGSGVIGEATGVGLHIYRKYDVVFYDIKKKKTLISESKHINDLDLKHTDITMICVPTPTINGKMDLEAIIDAAIHIGDQLRELDKYHLVVVRSTVLPYVTEQIVIPILESHSGKKVGTDFGVCMNPEFLRQRCALADSLKPWIIVIGAYDLRAYEVLYDAYSKFDCPIVHVDLKTAEIIKYVHNLFNAAKISFFNQIYMICENFGIDSDIVNKTVVKSAEGSWNMEYGTRGGEPYGGACLPKDIKAFISFCHENNINPCLLDEVESINEEIRMFEKRKKTDRK